MVNWSLIVSFLFPEYLDCCYIYIFTAPTSTTIIVTLEPCALNAEFQHFILRFNKISLLCRYHWDFMVSLRSLHLTRFENWQAFCVQEGTCGRFGVLRPFTMNGEYILDIRNKGCVTLWPCQKMNYENSNISPWKNVIFKKYFFTVS